MLRGIHATASNIYKTRISRVREYAADLNFNKTRISRVKEYAAASNIYKTDLQHEQLMVVGRIAAVRFMGWTEKIPGKLSQLHECWINTWAKKDHQTERSK